MESRLDSMNIGPGKKARMHRLLYEKGPGKGTLLLLPIDHGLEHGPGDFVPNPPSADPEFQLRLALEGGYSGIAFQVGLAEKYISEYAGRVPLVLKLNGKTSIPSDEEPFSPLNATVEDAVRLGADAVGYTLYVGSPAQDRDLAQFREVRREAERLGMPVIMWAYPRGRYVESKGGKNSLFAIDYASRVACEVGADMVKLNMPKVDEETMKKSPEPYRSMNISFADAMKRIVASAGKTLVLISGGDLKDEADLLEKVRVCMEAGATGLIFGRNMWQRKFADALSVTGKIRELILNHAIC
jgi:class I fructose-bisphosphate aldolase